MYNKHADCPHCWWCLYQSGGPTNPSFSVCVSAFSSFSAASVRSTSQIHRLQHRFLDFQAKTPSAFSVAGVTGPCLCTSQNFGKRASASPKCSLSKIKHPENLKENKLNLKRVSQLLVTVGSLECMCVVDMSRARSRTLASDHEEMAKSPPWGEAQRDSKAFCVQVLTVCAENINHSFLLRDAPPRCSY